MPFEANATGINCDKGYFKAQYYNNVSFLGAPVYEKCENNILYHWNGNSPAPGVNAKDFSVRWSGMFNFPKGKYNFRAKSNDGLRLIIGSDKIIDSWRDQGFTQYEREYEIKNAIQYITLEHFQRQTSTDLQLTWIPIASTPPTNVPCSNQNTINRFCEQFYVGKNFNFKVYENIVDKINYNWAYGAPGTQTGVDEFSAKWTGNFSFTKGTYEFKVKSDDGMRITIDNNIVYNEWHSQTADERKFTYIVNSNSNKNVKVEYYENRGVASAKVDWQKIHSNPVPTTTPTPIPGEHNLRAFVTNYYDVFLNRQPDQSGLNWWTEGLRNEFITCTQLSSYFINSTEYKNRYVTNDMFIMSLPKALLFRNMEMTYEFQYWRNVWANLNPNMSTQEKRNVLLRQYIMHNHEFFGAKCREYGVPRI